MRKLLLIWIAIFVLLLPACSANQSIGSENNLLTQGSAATGELMLSWIQIPVAYTWEEYYTLMPSVCELVPNFIHLESVSFFGNFLGFNPVPNSGGTQYSYTFGDTEGNCIELTITHTTTQDSISTQKYPLASVTPDMTSMRYAPFSDNHIIVRNGAEYYYNKFGCLYTIVWHGNGVTCQLAGNITQYNTDIYNRMVSISETEAAAAFAELKTRTNDYS